MRLLQEFIGVIWLIFVAYWIIKSQSVKQTQKNIGGWWGNVQWVLPLVAVYFMEGARFYPFNIHIFHYSLSLAIITFIVGISGLVICLVARYSLADNWSGSVTLKKHHTLVTTGMYNYMRHPIYSGMLLIFLGTALAFSTSGAVIGFVVIVLLFWFKLKREEKLMLVTFPKEYKAYKIRVKALIPHIL